MSSKRPLSISAAKKYSQNPFEYFLHYVMRLRPKYKMSYFIFGGIVDKPFNALLEGKSLNEALEIGEEAVKQFLVENVQFIPSDYDGEILDSSVVESLDREFKKLGWTGDNVHSLISELLNKPFNTLSENQKRALQLACYESLRVKARLMIEAYSKKVMPHLSEIQEVQQQRIWKDNKGNEYTGIPEFRAKYKGKLHTFDNKTASNVYRDYPEDVVAHNVQLATYTNVTGDNHAAFAVLNKHVKKNRVRTCSQCKKVCFNPRVKTCDQSVKGARCGGSFNETISPDIEVVIRTGQIDNSEKQFIAKSMAQIAEAIEKKVFPHALEVCEPGRCPYWNYCRTGSMEGLEIVPETEEKGKK